MSKIEALKRIEEKIKQSNLLLSDTATNVVFGKGNVDAKILFIGEAPGEKEDLQGIPFVGAAGKQLDGLLSMISLSLDDVYIANILKYRPPKNRDPNDDEIREHTPFLVEQIKVIKPEVIVTLGNFSTKFVLAGFSTDGMKQIQGISILHGTMKEMVFDDLSFKVIPIYHPAAMLYRPTLKDIMKKDFLKIAKEIFPDKTFDVEKVVNKKLTDF